LCCNNYSLEKYRRREDFGEENWHRVGVISSHFIKVTVGKKVFNMLLTLLGS